MTRPGKEQVSVDDTPYYHIVSRCVRRSFLCGVDHSTGKSYEHRRQWIVWYEQASTLYAWFLVPVVILTILIFVLIMPFEQGKSVAESQIKELERHKCNRSLCREGMIRCTSLLDISEFPNKVLGEGILVTVNGDRVAIFNGEVIDVWALTDSIKVQQPVLY